MTIKIAQKKLLKISEDTNNSDLKRNIAQDIIDELGGYDKAEGFFNDLMASGCSSGMIGWLIYYQDTHRFYDDNYNDIEELRQEYEAEIGEPIRIDGDLKNFLAWFAFEEVAKQLASEIGLEI
jgi:hypothetical protein